jgi:mannan endo-1,4-beta-mannosidase
MRKPILLIFALMAIVLPAASTGPVAWADVPALGTANTSSDEFVTRAGTKLRLSGNPYRFTGLNIYNANSVDNCWYTLGEVNSELGHPLHRTLERVGPGNEVFRAWFFQSLGTTEGVRDWSAFDNTLAVARRHGVKVIATLGNQWGQCEGYSYPAGYKTESWYEGDYRALSGTSGMPTSYRRYVREVVSRYKDDPTILAWQLMNEAEAKTAYGGSCASTAPATLKAFAADMASLVKSIDPNHLLSLGTIGSGQCGAEGSEYKDLHDVNGIDLCEYHDYQPEAMPGDEWNGLSTRLRECNELGKPLFVGELGIRTDAVGTHLARAGLLASKLSSQFTAGVVGVLAWAWRNGVNGGSSDSGYEIGPGDPALGVLGAY